MRIGDGQLVQELARQDAIGGVVAPVQRRARLDFFRQPIHQDRDRDDGFFAHIDEATSFLTLDGRLTRVGVFDYQDNEGNIWGELRTADEVFAPQSLDSFKQCVVTNDHPASFVDVANVKDVQVGHVGTDVRRDGDFIRATITITDAKTIIAILAGKKELSCGYTAELVDAAGEQDGKNFHAVQTNIRGNHLAIVDVGRAGPDCALISRGDGAAFTVGADMAAKKNDSKAGAAKAPGTKPRKPSEIATALVTELKADAEERGDAAAEMAQQVIDLLSAAMKSGNEMLIKGALLSAAEMLAAPAEAPPEPAPEEDPAPDGEEQLLESADEDEEDQAKDTGTAPPPEAAPAHDSAAVVKLQAKVDMLEANQARNIKRAKDAALARVKLEQQIRGIVPTFDPKGRSDADLMRAVVLEVSPDQKARLDANKSNAGYLQACFDAAVELHTQREAHLGDAPRLGFDAVEHGDENDPMKAYDDYIARRTDRGKAKRAAS